MFWECEKWGSGVIRGKMWFYYWENGIILEIEFTVGESAMIKK